MLALEAGASIAPSKTTPTLSVSPVRTIYTVVLDKQGIAPAKHPLLKFKISGPPGHLFDIQVSRGAPELLQGGAGLPGAWDKSKAPDLRMAQLAFSSWTNGEQSLALDANGHKTYQMPLDWWRDLARLPLSTFEKTEIYYRVLAWPSSSPTPTHWSTDDGSTAPQVTVQNNLVSFDIIESGDRWFDHGSSSIKMTLGYTGIGTAKKVVAMQYVVREEKTTDMYTLVQWMRGYARQWPAGNNILWTNYGIEHLAKNLVWTIDQLRTDPRYVDSVDVANGDGFTHYNSKTAITNDSPGGPITNSGVTHSFFSVDFDTRVHLNFEVPSAVTITRMEGPIVITNPTTRTIYALLEAVIAPPEPFIIARGYWKARILQTVTPPSVTHPETYFGPP